ncbi:hypothetical protein VNO78_26024 [Psophocarpus tetragonolobus]|uniref:Helicase ATP-binding domain-containing protein n=1 Tax=Psophocarpus tetragonolobus TaxID=3891 RepID=A0AAN9S056_PSOTE
MVEGSEVVLAWMRHPLTSLAVKNFLSVGFLTCTAGEDENLKALLSPSRYLARNWGDNGLDPPLFGFQTKVDILVAIPGMLVDHLNNELTLEHLHYLVVDETDRLLREDYQS